MRDKFKGALIGLAVGDALGATTEFMTKEEVKDQYVYLSEIIGGGWLDLKAGEVTDDTEMTLCVARGILQNYENPIDKIGEEFIAWFKSDPKDIGVTTINTLSKYKGNWFEAAKLTHKKVGQSAGNGSLMRCLPIALAYDDKKLMNELTIKQSNMTHYDKKAAEACLIYNNIAMRIINGFNLNNAIELEIMNTRYKNVLTKKLKTLPNGYVVNTFSWVLQTLYTTNNFPDVIETLANLGEDSDTTSAIAGGIAGLYYGYDSIDNKYKNKILIKNEIEDIAEKLYDIRLIMKDSK